MVEPVSISLGILAASFVAKAVEEAGSQAAEAGVRALAKVRDVVLARFRRTSDDQALTALDQLTEVPDSPTRLRALADAIERHAGVSPEFATELQSLIDSLDAAKGGDRVIQQAWGNAIQVAQVHGSTVNINRGP